MFLQGITQQKFGFSTELQHTQVFPRWFYNNRSPCPSFGSLPHLASGSSNLWILYSLKSGIQVFRICHLPRTWNVFVRQQQEPSLLKLDMLQHKFLLQILTTMCCRHTSKEQTQKQLTQNCMTHWDTSYFILLMSGPDTELVMTSESLLPHWAEITNTEICICTHMALKQERCTCTIELHGHSMHSMFLPTSIQSCACSTPGNAYNCP